jgi:hypothetical protein
MKTWMLISVVGAGLTFGALSIAAGPTLGSGSQFAKDGGVAVDNPGETAAAKDGGVTALTTDPVEPFAKEAGVMLGKEAGVMLGKEAGNARGE